MTTPTTTTNTTSDADSYEQVIPPTSPRESFYNRSEPIEVSLPGMRRPRQPELRFSPYAWAKLIFMRDSVTTEIGGMGIAELDDPLLITDIVIPKQTVSGASVDFDMEDYEDRLTRLCDPDERDPPLQPAQCMRVWIHTHPGMSPEPSYTDEKTFAESWGCCDWALMFILATDGSLYARMVQRTGGVESVQLLRCSIEWNTEFPKADREAWATEIRERVVAWRPVVREYGNRHDAWITGVGVTAERLPSLTKSAVRPASSAQEGFTGVTIWDDEDDWGLRWGQYLDDNDIGGHSYTPYNRHAQQDFTLRSFDYEVNRDDVTSWARTASLPEQSEFGPGKHDLLGPLEDDMFFDIVSEDLTSETVVTDEMLQALEGCGVYLHELEEGTNKMIFRVDFSTGESVKVRSSQLIQFTENYLAGDANMSETVKEELKKFEEAIFEVASERDPKTRKQYIDFVGLACDRLVPWRMQDGRIMWVATGDETDLLMDVVSGVRDYQDAVDEAEALFEEYEKQAEDDEEEDATPLYSQHPKPAEEKELDTVQSYQDAFEICSNIVRSCTSYEQQSGTTTRRFNASEIDQKFKNLLRGAKTGGFLGPAYRIVQIFRRCDYSITDARHEYEMVVASEISQANGNREKAPPMRDPMVQPTLRVSNDPDAAVLDLARLERLAGVDPEEITGSELLDLKNAISYWSKTLAPYRNKDGTLRTLADPVAQEKVEYNSKLLFRMEAVHSAINEHFDELRGERKQWLEAADS